MSAAEITSLPLLSRGKVRDIYAVDERRLLMVASDRLSAFDVVLPQPFAGKGRVLTTMSQFWFDRLQHICANHYLPDDPQSVVAADEREQVEGRAMVVRRLKPLMVEAVCRGYLAGSGWKDYQKTGAVCGLPLPAGLKLSARLPQPLYTPSTKAPIGEHDENITFAQTEELLGADMAAKVRDTTLNIYNAAANAALQAGVIIADTKFEFAADDNGELILIDEVLTPDSSRFWPADEWQEGRPPPSFDKQIVRDYLAAQAWDQKPPAPVLPDEVLQKTAARYEDIQNRLLALPADAF